MLRARALTSGLKTFGAVSAVSTMGTRSAVVRHLNFEEIMHEGAFRHLKRCAQSQPCLAEALSCREMVSS